jgi:DNA-binding CsgD family transcriptional regulator
MTGNDEMSSQPQAVPHFAHLTSGQRLRLWKLSRKEEEVLGWLQRGLSEKEIANELGRSLNTVHVHVKHLYRKFDVRSRGELLALSLAGLRPPAHRRPRRSRGAGSKRGAEQGNKR